MKTLLLLVSIFICSGLAIAQAYPDRAIRIVVPYAAGGGTDTALRPIAQKMGELSGQGVYVDNRPGGDSIVGVDAVAKSKPDGYTVLAFDDTVLVNSLTNPNLPYNLKDLVPIAPLVRVPLMLVVAPQFPVNSVRELVELAKKKPGDINYASLGETGMNAMALEYLASTAGIKMTAVPYRGLAAAMVAISVNESQVAVVGLTAGLEQVKGGRLKPLAVLSKERDSRMPSVPAISETYPQFEIAAFNGFMVPSKTPPAVIEKLADLIAKAEADPGIRSRQAITGSESWKASPAEYKAFVDARTKFWEERLRAEGIKIN